MESKDESKDESGKSNAKPPTADKPARKHAALNNTIIKSAIQLNNKNTSISSEVKQYIREQLTQANAKGETYMKQYVKAFLKEAKRDVNSPAGKMLANSIFTDKLLDRLDEDESRGLKDKSEYLIYRLRNTLYDKQQVIYDNRQDRTILMIAGRRWGKTELMARMLIKDAISIGGGIQQGRGGSNAHHALYLNRNFDNALAQMWNPVINLLNELGIPHEATRGDGLIKFKGGGDIRFGGANNTIDIDRFRGFKFSFVGIDEVGHLKGLKYLFDEIIQPATIDYANSQIFMIGTPPRSRNYAYQLCHKDTIRHYSGTFMDNPYIPNKDEIIPRIAKEHGVEETSSFIRREYLGDTEAFDDEALIFKGYKTYDKIDKDILYTHAYVGVDWGYEDEAAVIGTVVDDRTKTMYVVSEWHASRKATSEICEKVKEAVQNIKDNYKLNRPVWTICDNNDKSGVFELYHTYKLSNVFCAYKYDKDLAIEQMAEWFRVGNIKTSKGGYIATECDNTVWKRDKDTDALLHEIDDDSYHPNGLMALLYVSRQFAFDVMGGEHVRSAKEILEEKYN